VSRWPFRCSCVPNRRLSYFLAFCRQTFSCENPMILASHVIFGAYGFWLPNDPRGSWSDFVACWELYRYGKASKVETTQSLAHAPHDRAARIAAKSSL